MTTTTDAENKPTISNEPIVFKPARSATIPASLAAAITATSAPATTATAPATPSPATTATKPATPATIAIPATSTIPGNPATPATVLPTPIPRQPSPRSQACCKVHRTKVDYNIFSKAKAYGVSYMYCGELTCLHPPCIKYRVFKKFGIYNEAFGVFGSGIDIFFDRLNTNQINEATRVVSELYRRYLILDCFDHIEFFAADPLNNLVNTSLFRHVHDYQMELVIALEHHLVQPAHLNVTYLSNEKRVRHRHININKHSAKVATIDGYYATPGPAFGTPMGQRVKYLTIDKVIWRVHPILPNGTVDMTKTIVVGYQEAKTIYRKQIADLYDYEFK